MYHKIGLTFCIYITFIFLIYPPINAKTWYVGDDELYKYCSQLSNLVKDYDTIYIKAGKYINDKQVTWVANHLSIIGIGNPELIAGNSIAQDISNGKGIFVTKGNDILIENITFLNAKVVDNNGAGIRQEGCNLIIRHCYFGNNEMGILCGSIPQCKTTIEYCTFTHNGSSDNPGYQHNLYINHIDTLIFRYNISKDAIAQGHELKSRAAFNIIAYNLIANVESEDSRTIDLPNGGTSILVGNIITQGQASANNNIIGYGLEGMTNPAPHILALANNTIVNFKNKGSFIHIPNAGCDSLIMYNNIFGGLTSGQLFLGQASATIDKGNYIEPLLDKLYFNDLNSLDFTLDSQSPCINEGFDTEHAVQGISLRPKKEIVNGDINDRHRDNHIDCGAHEKILTNTSQLTQSYRAYPNPFNDFLYVNTASPIIIYDAIGQYMGKYHQSMIHTHTWSAGTYYIMGENLSQKVVKQ